METSVVIRPATVHDADAVAAVLIESRRAFLPFAPLAHPEDDVRRWVHEHLMPNERVVVWDAAARVVAMLAVSVPGQQAWIHQLYVRPGWTGQGIGARLLDWAHAQLTPPVHLWTFQANAGARRFYERHGYQAVTFTHGQDNEERCPDVLYRRDAGTRCQMSIG
jgi:GNAT superfamily N-acetyltransferase